jgi:hypothetical protein
MKLLNTKGKVIPGKLTTESNYEQPMLVVEGQAYGPGDIGIFGLYRASEAKRKQLKKYGYSFFIDVETLYPGETISEMRKWMSQTTRTLGWKVADFWEDVITEKMEHTPAVLEILELKLFVQNRGNSEKQAFIKKAFCDIRNLLGIEEPKGLVA